MRTKSLLSLAMAVFAICGIASCGQKTEAKNQKEPILEEIKTLQIDNVKVTWLQDKATSQPAKIFDADSTLVDSLGLQDGVPSSISTFLVEVGDKKILFDTGLGGENGRLKALLDSIGIKPADIKYLYLTHFHGDHIGGMMDGNSAVFVNAEVYASQPEYDGWMAMEDAKKAQVVKTMGAYKEQLHLFAFGDTLPGDVLAIDAVGHTPGHTVFQIGKLLIIGDIIHGAALQLEDLDVCPTFDMDKTAAIASRKRILEYAKENGLTMAGMHLPSPAFMVATEL